MPMGSFRFSHESKDPARYMVVDVEREGKRYAARSKKDGIQAGLRGDVDVGGSGWWRVKNRPYVHTCPDFMEEDQIYRADYLRQGGLSASGPTEPLNGMKVL